MARLDLKLYLHRLKDLEGIYNVSEMLAHYFPKPEHYITAIYELLINALEHGNLGIGYDYKAALLRCGKWQEEIAKRLASPDYANKEIAITLQHDEEGCRLAICDQGTGFAWQEYKARSVDPKRPNGRGLWIVFNSHFDDIYYNQAGNEVICVAHYSHHAAHDTIKVA